MEKFLAGEKVRVISGGPTMTVEGYELSIASILGEKEYTDDVWCVWFEGNKNFREKFNENIIKRTEK